MVNRPLVLFATAALAVLPARAADEALQLRWIDTSILTTRIKDYPELQGVVLYPSRNSVKLRGTEEQIARAKSTIALLDVSPAQFAVQIEVVRYTMEADGKATERTVSAPLISTLDGLPAEIGTDTSIVSLTPISNRDGTVTLSVEYRQAEEAGDIGLWARNERRMTLGQEERFLGLVNSTDKDLRKAVRDGKVVKDRGAYTAYYLDVTVHSVDPTTGQPQPG